MVLLQHVSGWPVHYTTMRWGGLSTWFNGEVWGVTLLNAKLFRVDFKLGSKCIAVNAFHRWPGEEDGEEDVPLVLVERDRRWGSAEGADVTALTVDSGWREVHDDGELWWMMKLLIYDMRTLNEVSTQQNYFSNQSRHVPSFISLTDQNLAHAIN